MLYKREYSVEDEQVDKMSFKPDEVYRCWVYISQYGTCMYEEKELWRYCLF